jgi:hypothetical protein
MRRPRMRFWIEALLASTTAALTILTAIVPTWIEVVVHEEPDGGNASVELGILVAFAVATVVLSVGAGREWRRITASV